LEFKRNEEGKNLEDSIRDNRIELKDLKSNVKQLTDKCNDSKKHIDSVKNELDKKQDERRENQRHQMLDDEDAMDDDGP